jgi:hypothetical protein
MICDGDMDGLNSSDKSKVRGAESQGLILFNVPFLEFKLDYNTKRWVAF